MTQFQSAPASAGSEHRVKPTALALHVASAASWGRPWRRRALSLPSPQALTFKGIRLPLQPMRSWLQLLSRAGMLGVRPPAAGVLRQPDEGEEDAPTRIEDLGFEMATEMILDFANFARQSRHNSSAEEVGAEPEAVVAASSNDEPSALASTVGIDQLHGLSLAGSVASESLDQDFLVRESSAAKGRTEAAQAPQEQIAELPPMPEAPLPLDEPPVELTMEALDVPALVERGESAAVEPVLNVQERVERPQVSTPETAASEGRTSPLVEDVGLQPVAAPVPMPFVEPVGEPSQLEEVVSELPAVEASVDTVAIEHEVEGPAETVAAVEASDEAVPEPIVQAPEIEEPVDQRQPSVVSAAPTAPVDTAAIEPEIEGPVETVADVEASDEAVPEPIVQAPVIEEPVEQRQPSVMSTAPTAPVVTAAIEPEVEGPAETVAAVEATVVAESESTVQAPVIEEAVEQRQLSAMSNAPTAPVITAAIEPEVVGPAETVAAVEETVVAVPEPIVQAPVIEEAVEQRQPSVVSTAAVPAVAVPEAGADSEVGHEQGPEPVVVTPKAAGPGIVVSDVRLARKVVARPRPSVERASAAPSLGVSLSADESAPEVEAALQHAQPAAVADAPEASALETIAASVCTTENTGTEAAEPAQSPIAEAADQPETDHTPAVMHWEPVTPEQQPDLVRQVGTQVIEMNPEATVTDDFGLEPMIASLEDALAVLTVANVVRDATPAAKARLNAAHTSSAPLAAGVRQTDDNLPEATALQGIFIQKETEMTEMHDESIEVEAPANAPISSAELQEVAATLSVPQLEADPDDVLSDVQSTLNSLAGMAQGLTQQKQAAGRLQEELEEWNIQLQERERLAGDKEERLLQLENHLKQAKTNLDRMAAENNRLLAERSEALKELAQTVDLRDKTTVKRAESIQLEQQRIDEQTASLRTRASELDERESSLKRRSEELGVRLKQLQSAKDKFSTIVKSFNETVQFNSTLSAISKTVNE
ncbi:hypothetical protein [Pseudomonas sp. PDM19]|uniref:hypothetical protein n=1 Tax=Pseudomonas sp. PDM19 TaxID=2769272 RepID=UPI00177DF985|nr:hypothetical protein [Pseudomonas sp. PDM19]MBD9628848.1 hypothetical protein [Pseudomonas sp. PDM19]